MEILVLLDLSPVFDTFDHSVLFDLLHNTFRIRGTALSILMLYLHS